MRLLPRRPLLAAVLAALLLLIALPITWTDQAPWHGIAPALSYAGGSPDETLSPPAYPPSGSRRSATIVRPESQSADRAAVSAPVTGRPGEAYTLTRGDFVLVWWINVTSLLRF
jgi:hypothetical protein